jgi:hypothetical protein
MTVHSVENVRRVTSLGGVSLPHLDQPRTRVLDQVTPLRIKKRQAIAAGTRDWIDRSQKIGPLPRSARTRIA